jgi:hypothetical protein
MNDGCLRRMQFASLLLYAGASAWVTEISQPTRRNAGGFPFLTHKMQPAAKAFGFGLRGERF